MIIAPAILNLILLLVPSHPEDLDLSENSAHQLINSGPAVIPDLQAALANPHIPTLTKTAIKDVLGQIKANHPDHLTDQGHPLPSVSESPQTKTSLLN